MQGAEPPRPRLEIRLLGPVEVAIGERVLALRRRKQRALVALLALNANRVVSTDRLLDGLWGESPPPTASVALYGLISGVRKLLEPSDADLARGRNGDLVPELEALVAEHPLRERVRAQLMLALYHAGRQADALAVYRDARAELVDGLGLDPSSQLQEIERAILRHDPLLSPSPPSKAGDAAASAPRRTRRTRWIAGTVLAAAAVVAVTAFAVTRSGTHRAIRVAANGVGVIEHGKVVAAETAGAAPSSIAVGGGSVWMTSTDGQTVSRIE